jgi:hypothetical protein
MRRTGVMAMLLGLHAAFGWESPAFAQEAYEVEPINYSRAPVNDPVSVLARAVEEGTVTLTHDSKFGYLTSVLDRLGIPVASQVLVFSKTSLQIQRISPSAPRAIYFNDDVYVGFVCGGDVLEISAADPKQGAVFYTLDQRHTEVPRLVRQTDRCLSCHSSGRTLNVPGHLMRSVAVDHSGFPLPQRSYNTTHDSPLSERWGGWYVTGEDGGQTHMGNAIAAADRAPAKSKEDMTETINTTSYLAPTSDIVSLMVLGHQSHMHNLITRAGFEARITAAYDRAIRDPIGEPAVESNTTRRRLDRAADELVRYMLFLDEPAIDEPVAGTSPFAAEFSTPGPRDRLGRSLRDLDLNRRLFKYPCSYLIYSEAFNALPDSIKGRVYRQLFEILTARNRNIDYAMTARDRKNLFEILRDTKPDLPAYWKEQSALNARASGGRQNDRVDATE